jgi:hypothetical protein
MEASAERWFLQHTAASRKSTASNAWRRTAAYRRISPPANLSRDNGQVEPVFFIMIFILHLKTVFISDYCMIFDNVRQWQFRRGCRAHLASARVSPFKLSHVWKMCKTIFYDMTPLLQGLETGRASA